MEKMVVMRKNGLFASFYDVNKIGVLAKKNKRDEPFGWGYPAFFGWSILII